MKRFFFSSRRRQTRCLSDWSSDVCSSDLQVDRVGDRVLDERVRHAVGGHRERAPHDLGHHEVRSEERCVGKGCRCRWPHDQYKKTTTTTKPAATAAGTDAEGWPDTSSSRA